MARPKLSRLVTEAPNTAGFKPFGKRNKRQDPIHLQYDEYEAIRLLDFEGMQQTEAAMVMNVSRPTLTRIYDSARKVIAKGLVEGRTIIITGGNKDFDDYKQQKVNIKIMNQKIAIPTNNGKLFPHFGKAPQVTIATVKNGQIAECIILDAPEHKHGSMPRFMADHGCTDVICGGLGQGAVDMLNQLGIQVHNGAPALIVEEVLEQYLNGSIVYGDGGCPGGGHHHHHHGEGSCHHDH